MHSIRSTALFIASFVLFANSGFAIPPRIAVTHIASTGSLPKGLAISPDGTTLYVANYGQRNRRNISILDTSDLHLIATIDVPGIVVESAVSPDGRTLYVSNFTRSSVQFIDLQSRQVTHEVHTTGRNPKIIVLSHDGRRLFAANWSSRNVTEIDTETAQVVRTLPAGLNPRGMAMTRGGRLFIANFFGNTIDVYDGADMSQHHEIQRVCRIPRHLVLSPDETRLYVSCLGQDEVISLDVDSGHIEHRARVGFAPKAIDVSADGQFIFVANYGDHSLTLIDTTDWHTRTLEIPVMDHASGIIAAREGSRCFVTGWYDDHVYTVDPEGTSPALSFTPAQREFTLRRRAYHRDHPAE